MNNKNGTPLDMLATAMKEAEVKGLNKSSISSASINQSTVVCSLFKIDETREQKENRCYTFIKQYKNLFWVERIFLLCICTAVAGGFSIPIIIYAVNTDLGNTTRLSSDIDFDICSNAITQVCKMIKCCYSYACILPLTEFLSSAMNPTTTPAI